MIPGFRVPPRRPKVGPWEGPNDPEVSLPVSCCYLQLRNHSLAKLGGTWTAHIWLPARRVSVDAAAMLFVFGAEWPMSISQCSVSEDPPRG